MVNMEVKSELGENGCSYIQSSSYYIDFIRWLKGNLCNRSRLPTLQLYLEGVYAQITILSVIAYTYHLLLLLFLRPYPGVAGVVFLDIPVYEPITVMMLLFYLPYNEYMLLESARMFKALNIVLVDLEKLYNNLVDQQNVTVDLSVVDRPMPSSRTPAS